MENQTLESAKQEAPQTLPGLPAAAQAKPPAPTVPAVDARPPPPEPTAAERNPMPPNYDQKVRAMCDGTETAKTEAGKAVVDAIRPQALELRNLLQHIAQSEQALANAQQMRLRLEGALNAQTALVWHFENPLAPEAASSQAASASRDNN